MTATAQSKTLSSEPSTRTLVYNEAPSRVYAVLFFVSVCYFGKYFCMSDMYITQALFQLQEGVTAEQMSFLFAMGYVSSVCGKITAGILSDAWGGKPVLMMSGCGYITCTLLFSIVPKGGFALYSLVWIVNSFFALGITWVAVVAMVSNWIPVSHMGRLMALVSLAPQLGDALARAVLASVVNEANNWRTVFQVAAGIALVIMLPVACLLNNAPPEEQQKMAAADKQQAESPARTSFGAGVAKLGKNPLLYAVVGLSGSLYGIRVLFLLYSSTFLASTFCVTYRPSLELADCAVRPETLGRTSIASTAFTLSGCLSVLLVGSLKDSLPKRHRAGMLSCFVAMLIGTLLVMALNGISLSYEVSACLVGLVGMALFGPYKMLGTAFANDIGGKALKGTACSLMGISDNVTAVLVLLIKGQIGADWVRMFFALLAMSVVALCCVSYMWLVDLRRHREDQQQQGGYAQLGGGD